MNNNSVISQKSATLTERLEKDMKSGYITILILQIIKNEKQVWGYRIKQLLQQLTGNEIQNSSLYTILRNLESKYHVVTSEMIDRRRYYVLTPEGHKQSLKAVNFWSELLSESKTHFKKLNIPLSTAIKEVIT